MKNSEFTDVDSAIAVYQGIAETDGFSGPLTVRRTRFHDLGTGIKFDGPIDESGPIKKVKIYSSIFRNVNHGIHSSRNKAGYKNIVVRSTQFVDAKHGVTLPGTNFVDVDFSNNKFRRISKTALKLNSRADATARGVSITGNTFVNNQRAVALRSTHASLRRNAIGHNTKGVFLWDEVKYNFTQNNVYNNSEYGLKLADMPEMPTVNATHTYWGAETGPAIETNPEGSGDRLIGSTATYRPFAKTPVENVSMPDPASQDTSTDTPEQEDGQSSDSSEDNDQSLTDTDPVSPSVDSEDDTLSQLRQAVPFPILPAVVGIILIILVFLVGYKIG